MNVRFGKLHFACLFLPLLFVKPCWAQSDLENDWKQKIALQLRAHVHFPSGTASRGGEARVAFSLDRSGRVISAELRKSTGFPELDAAALEAVEKAQPFPIPPPEVEDGKLRFIAPIVFAKAPSPTNLELGKNESEEKLRAQLRGICRGC